LGPSAWLTTQEARAGYGMRACGAGLGAGRLGFNRNSPSDLAVQQDAVVVPAWKALFRSPAVWAPSAYLGSYNPLSRRQRRSGRGRIRAYWVGGQGWRWLRRSAEAPYPPGGAAGFRAGARIGHVARWDHSKPGRTLREESRTRCLTTAALRRHSGHILRAVRRHCVVRRLRWITKQNSLNVSQISLTRSG